MRDFPRRRKQLAFAQKYGLEVTCRSGGHSTAGYSVNFGLVIDLSRMNYVVVDPKALRAIVGAGACFEKINACLDQYRLHLPGAGGCAFVGLGGYVQGGGYGFTSLLYGMSSDNVAEMVVALADGTIVRANETTNVPLFWALRGGTGNNFGVVMEVTYRLQSLWRVWGFGIRWDIENAPAALAEMQRGFTGAGTPANLGYQCLMEWIDEEGSTERKPVLQMRGIYNGDEEDGRRALRSLLTTKGAFIEISRVDSYEVLNNFLLQDLTEGARLPAQVREEVDSRYVTAPLGEAEWRELTEAFRNSPNDGNMIGTRTLRRPHHEHRAGRDGLRPSHAGLQCLCVGDVAPGRRARAGDRVPRHRGFDFVETFKRRGQSELSEAEQHELSIDVLGKQFFNAACRQTEIRPSQFFPLWTKRLEAAAFGRSRDRPYRRSRSFRRPRRAH